MKQTLVTTIALAACVSTCLSTQGQSSNTQNTKEDVITFSLTVQAQSSISDLSGSQNHGTWTAPLNPNTKNLYYKTKSAKLTQVDLIKAISRVRHISPDWYGNNAKLVLVQGELTGFFNITEELADSYELFDQIPQYGMDEYGNPTTNYVDGDLNGEFYNYNSDIYTGLQYSTDSTYLTFANGRHLETNPLSDEFEIQFNPVGHMQPWGQIYVKYVKNGVTLCENVTYFFGITVQECYDCFYMNSYISDATFTRKTTTGAQNGPPCCNVSQSSTWLGNGKDRYYMSLSFDNTDNNPYLNPYSGTYVGYQGISDTIADGIHPDLLEYTELILSRLGSPSPYEVRFTLNGIMTYTWNLKWINSNGYDISPEFVGSGSYPCTGYGFIQLYCCLLNGTVNFKETIVKEANCCTGIPWYDSWYGVGHYNDYESYADMSNFYFDMWLDRDGEDTPFNAGPSLSYHANFNEAYTPYVTHYNWDWEYVSPTGK